MSTVVTQANFESEIVEASMNTPVLVDFWAPWCGPCRTLMPTLERITESFNGALKLTKVNTDEEQTLAQMFGIRSLPTVVLFKDGRPVDGFMGAQPEGAIRSFLTKHLIAERAPEDQAEELPEPQDLDLEDKVAELQGKIAAEPEREEHRAELADLMAKSGDLEAAKKLLASLSALAEGDAAKKVHTRIAFADIADAAPNAVDLQDAIAKDTKNLRARHQLGVRFINAGQYAAGLDQFLTILRTDRAFEGDIGRKSMLDAFKLIEDADLVSDYRRKMSAALF
jgi:putative thioredoxin